MDFTRSREAIAAYNRLCRTSPQVDPTANDAAERSESGARRLTSWRVQSPRGILAGQGRPLLAAPLPL